MEDKGLFTFLICCWGLYALLLLSTGTGYTSRVRVYETLTFSFVI